MFKIRNGYKNCGVRHMQGKWGTEDGLMPDGWRISARHASEISSLAMPQKRLLHGLINANNFSRHANPSGYRDIEHLIMYKKADSPNPSGRNRSDWHIKE
jgi:hypothetical protein